MNLWTAHFWLTREVVTDATYGIPCLNEDLAALYQNQKDLGHNFGELTKNREAGEKLAHLLKEHIRIAVEIVQAAIAGKDILNLYAEWKYNASEIAETYHKYNKKLKYKEMNKMMQEHLSTTLNEAVAIITKECKESRERGDIALEHIIHMADYINSKF